jgi:ribonuclease HI
VPGHEGTVGNEMADQLARTGPEHPFIRPEPACSISVGVAKKVVKDWMNRNHKKLWESITVLKQAKGLKLGLSARRTKGLLKLNRDQLRWVVGLFRGHCHLKGHLFELGLTYDSICERCL